MSDKYDELMEKLESGQVPDVRFPEDNITVFDCKTGSMPNTELSEKEKLFCLNYVHNGMNIYQAAVSAGYAPSYAKSSSYKLMEKVGVKEYISELFSQVEKTMKDDIVMSKLELMKFWSDIARGKLQNPHAVPKKAEEAMEQLSFFTQDKNGSDVFSVPDECKIPLSQRMKASEYIAKYYDMIADNVNQTINNNTVVGEDLKNLSDEELEAMLRRQIGGASDG